jgi:hypothetical protein
MLRAIFGIAGRRMGLVSAYHADRIGRRANFILFAVCSILTVFVHRAGFRDDACKRNESDGDGHR